MRHDKKLSYPLRDRENRLAGMGGGSTKLSSAMHWSLWLKLSLLGERQCLVSITLRALLGQPGWFPLVTLPLLFLRT